jgi:hypothetical protein
LTESDKIAGALNRSSDKALGRITGSQSNRKSGNYFRARRKSRSKEKLNLIVTVPLNLLETGGTRRAAFDFQ